MESRIHLDSAINSATIALQQLTQMKADVDNNYMNKGKSETDIMDAPYAFFYLYHNKNEMSETGYKNDFTFNIAQAKQHLSIFKATTAETPVIKKYNEELTLLEKKGFALIKDLDVIFNHYQKKSSILSEDKLPQPKSTHPTSSILGGQLIFTPISTITDEIPSLLRQPKPSEEMLKRLNEGLAEECSALGLNVRKELKTLNIPTKEITRLTKYLKELDAPEEPQEKKPRRRTRGTTINHVAEESEKKSIHRKPNKKEDVTSENKSDNLTPQEFIKTYFSDTDDKIPLDKINELSLSLQQALLFILAKEWNQTTLVLSTQTTSGLSVNGFFSSKETSETTNINRNENSYLLKKL